MKFPKAGSNSLEPRWGGEARPHLEPSLRPLSPTLYSLPEGGRKQLRRALSQPSPSPRRASCARPLEGNSLCRGFGGKKETGGKQKG